MGSLNEQIKESKAPQQMSFVATGKDFYAPAKKAESDPIPTTLPLGELIDEQ